MRAAAARTWLDYNYPVRKSPLLLLIAVLLLAGCDLRAGLSGAGTSTPFIITSTLAPTAIPSATLTPIPPTPSPTTTPIDGMTTTQVNLRATPSTAGTQLGMLPPFAKVQIVGRDSSSDWYEVLYPQGPNGTGWVTAQYINVPQGRDSIPVIGGVPTSGVSPNETAGSAASGLVIQQVNVRKGPGTGFDALGMLNPKDVVALTGKDPSGEWLRVQYTGAPDGMGWVTATYIQVTATDGLPIVGASRAQVGTGTPTSTPAVLAPTPGAALDDGDSAQAPAAAVTFSSTGTRALIYASDVSAPQGDRQDWVQFTTYSEGVLLSLTCTGNSTLAVQILQQGSAPPDWAGPKCGESRQIQLPIRQTYILQISIFPANETRSYVHYSLHIENVG